MSIYIGPQNATNKCLHIYKGSDKIERNPTKGTVFHSSMPYQRIRGRYLFQFERVLDSRMQQERYGLFGNSPGIPYDVLTSKSQFLVIRYFLISSSDYGRYDWARIVMPTTPCDFSAMIGPSFFYFSTGPTLLAQMATAFITSGSSIDLYYSDRPSLIEVIAFDDFMEPFTSNDVKINTPDVPSGITINGIELFSPNESAMSKMNFLHYIGDNPNNRLNDYFEVLPIPTGQSYNRVNGLPVFASCLQTSFNRFTAETYPKGGVNDTMGFTLFQVIGTKGVDTTPGSIFAVDQFYDGGSLSHSSIILDSRDNTIKSEVWLPYPSPSTDVYRKEVAFINPAKSFLRKVAEYRNMVLSNGNIVPATAGTCKHIGSIGVAIDSSSLISIAVHQKFLTNPNAGGSPAFNIIEPIEGKEEVVAFFIDYIKVVVRLSAKRLDFYNCRPVQSQFAFHNVPRYNYDLIIFDKTY